MISITAALLFAIPSDPNMGRQLALPDDQTIQQFLGRDCPDGYRPEVENLTRYGHRVFPSFLRILASATITPHQRANIFANLIAIPGDRSPFVDHAVAGLADHGPTARYTAVLLLAEIGGAGEVAPVLALLSDKWPPITYAAARTLVAIGDRRTVAALDVWLNTDAHKDDKGLREHVAKCRDNLKQRLDKPAPPKK